MYHCADVQAPADTCIIQILAVNADNVTSNDTMTTHLDGMSNAFDETNRVRCFNHTLQLSAKTLLRPFNIGISRGKAEDVADSCDGVYDEKESDDGDGDDEDKPNDYAESSEDVLADLDPDQRAELMEGTATVRNVVTKVSALFYFTFSTHHGP